MVSAILYCNQLIEQGKRTLTFTETFRSIEVFRVSKQNGMDMSKESFSRHTGRTLLSLLMFRRSAPTNVAQLIALTMYGNRIFSRSALAQRRDPPHSSKNTAALLFL